MFGKLLKHEWIAVKRLVGLLCLAVFASGLLCGGILKNMIWSSVTGNGIMVELYAMVLVAAFLTILFGCLGTKYLLVHRFFKSRFEDEGYLTFTLPVTTHQQLLASIVNTTLCTLLVGCVACVSAYMGMSIFLSVFLPHAQQEVIQVLDQAAAQTAVNAGLSGSWFLQGLELAAAFLADMILLMLACTMAMLLAKKHPILLGVAVYIGTDLVLSGLVNAAAGLSQGGLLLSCGLYTAAAVGGYFLMHRLMETKLNLN